MVFKIKDIDFEFVKISAIGDGSCMFHAILQGFNKTYTSSSNQQKQVMCRQFRNDLSSVLSEEINGKVCYDQLSRGQLKTFSEFVPETSLTRMKKSLKSNEWGDMRFIEMISNLMDINIIIIDYGKKNIYHMGDFELFIKPRDSIIIMVTNNIHFDTVGVNFSSGIRTLFSYNETVVQQLISKMYKEN
jgi:hypothetical protein